MNVITDKAGTSVSLDDITFVKSTFSSGNTDNCVEVGFAPNGTVIVRDTEARQEKPQTYTPSQWDAFLAGVRAGEFDRPGVA